MSAYLNLVTKEEVLAKMEVGDVIHDVREHAERMISNLYHLVELVEGQHEIIDLRAPISLETLPAWITPMRIVTTAKPPRGRKFKSRGRIAPDRWMGVRDYHILMDKFAQTLAEILTDAIVESRDIYNDTFVKRDAPILFD